MTEPSSVPAQPASDAPAPIIYFDGGCPVCSREIATYRGMQGAQACRWVDVSRCAEGEIGPGLTREQALAVMTVRRADGTLARGAQAFVEIWQALPKTRWLGRVAALPPVTALLDLGYAMFLRVRRAWRR